MTEAEPTVRGWRLSDAPAHLRELCPDASPRDWVFTLPPGLRGEYFYWLDEPQQCGMCDIRRFDLADGGEACFMLE